MKHNQLNWHKTYYLFYLQRAHKNYQKNPISEELSSSSPIQIPLKKQ